jgi:UDP-N-acetylmuramate dehydrogenase
MKMQEHVPLAPLTTFRVGGAARYLVEAASAAEVSAAVEWARARQLPLFVLGGGSNVVVADHGFPGLVLRVAIRGVEERREDGKTIIEAGAGEDWDALVARAVARECAGIECLSGIPGSVGGTPVQNVGAYGQEVSETISEVLVLDLKDGLVRTICRPGCGFKYRSSIFNTTERGRHIILRVTYALEPGGAPRIEYRDLQQVFAGKPAPTLAQTREAVRQIRLSKAMLIVEGDEDSRSAGSFFKNPVLSPAAYRELVASAAARGQEVPSYPAPGQQYKVPAAWLVEQAGFRKGYTRGPVGISRKHALAIVNRGGATAADIVALKDEVQRAVREQFGIDLAPEPVFVGFEE